MLRSDIPMLSSACIHRICPLTARANSSWIFIARSNAGAGYCPQRVTFFRDGTLFEHRLLDGHFICHFHRTYDVLPTQAKKTLTFFPTLPKWLYILHILHNV